jgi:DNA-binding NarL/FixJ family response regulator
MKQIKLSKDIRINFDDKDSYRQFLRTEDCFKENYEHLGKVSKRERAIITLLAMRWSYKKIRERSGISRRQISNVVVKFELNVKNWGKK